jgi:hypothetical protein
MNERLRKIKEEHGVECSCSICRSPEESAIYWIEKLEDMEAEADYEHDDHRNFE